MSYYPPPQVAPPYAPPPGYYPPPETSTSAVISLISGILGWTLLPFLGAIVAVISGHIAKGQIRSSMGRITGDGMATWGLLLGYSNLVLACCGTIVALLVLVILPMLGIAVSGFDWSSY